MEGVLAGLGRAVPLPDASHSTMGSIIGDTQRGASTSPEAAGMTGPRVDVTAGAGHADPGAGAATLPAEAALHDDRVQGSRRSEGVTDDAGVAAAVDSSTSALRDAAEGEENIGAWPAELSGAVPLRVSSLTVVRPASG